jgi:transposase
MSETRIAVIALHRSGKQPSEISKTLAIHRSTVHRTISRYVEIGTVCDRPRIGRPPSSNTSAVRHKIKARLQRNSQLSLRKVAKEIHINRETVRHIVKNVFMLNPYKLQRVHLLTEKMKLVRLQRASALLELAASRPWERIVFSDEKLFNVEQAVNSQNDRIWASSLSPSILAARKVSHSQKPAGVMVWAAVTSSGKSALHFVEPGVKINQDYYCENVLQGVLLPWATQHFGGQPWTFQQDSASSHRGKRTQAWCATHFPDFITSAEWPPYSPDLNPLDYSLWGILERKACCKPHKSLESLKRALEAAWSEIDTEQLRHITLSFPQRLQAVVAEKGGYIEH